MGVKLASGANELPVLNMRNIAVNAMNNKSRDVRGLIFLSNIRVYLYRLTDKLQFKIDTGHHIKTFAVITYNVEILLIRNIPEISKQFYTF